MHGDPRLYALLHELAIPFEYHSHPAAPTIEIAREYWKDIDSTHCRNLFMRNHKGDRHYLIIIEHLSHFDVHHLEQQLHQGKLSFASPERMMRYLGVTPGSVSPLALINDTGHHVHVFIDKRLQENQKVSFHPCINTASLVITTVDLFRFIATLGNTYSLFNP